jgi:hypothetical protein
MPPAARTTTGVLAKVLSASGTALVADNTAGGKIFSGRNNGVEKFSVSGNGNVVTSGSLTTGGNVEHHHIGDHQPTGDGQPQRRSHPFGDLPVHARLLPRH